jgi:hypothetical protein
MACSGMLSRLDLVRADVSKERFISIVRIILVSLIMVAICSSEISVLTVVTWPHVTEEVLLHNALSFNPRPTMEG